MMRLPLWPLAVLALLLAVAVQTVRLQTAQSDLATLEHQQELAWAQQKNLETQYRHDIAEKDKDTRATIAAAHADAGRARAAATGLRRDMVAYLEAHRHRATDAAATGQCAPDDGASMVLADLFSRADDAAGELAAAFDQARARGLGCEASYDAAVAASKETQWQ